MDRPKEILTTGDVARICNVAPRTVSKWFDTGQLRGYRIPGSKDRRIPLEQLIRFMKIHGIPLGKLETGHVRVLIVDADRDLCELARQVLQGQHQYEVETCESVFDAGACVERLRPSAIVIDTDLPGFDPRAISRHLTTHPELADTQLIAVGASLTESERQTFIQQGFHATLAKPFHIQQLIDLIEQTSSVHA